MKIPRLAVVLLLLLALVTPALAATRCLTYEERTMGRLQTVCDDCRRCVSGTRAVSTWSPTLGR